MLITIDSLLSLLYLTCLDTLPTKDLSNLSVSEPNTNPWQPALDEKSLPKPLQIPSISREDSGNEIWGETPPVRQAPAASDQPIMVHMDDPESPAWDEDSIPSPTIAELPTETESSRDNHQILEDQNAWHDNHGNAASQHQDPAPFIAHQDPTPEGEGWNLIDHAPIQAIGQQQSGIVNRDGAVIERFDIQEPPALPPRQSQEIPPLQPPRPVVSTTITGTSSFISPTTIAIQGQKKETYDIKKITWHDVTAAKNPRVSPILVQNANGPCPLLALVNALTLSTPAGIETALVDTLRSREQVSLGLLLDAVFDELMSGRRGDAAQELPDVSDLYSFLITLHTGMNVNPRFSPAAPTKSITDLRNSMSHVHPAEREEGIPGTFEDTREMKLYSTFSIPLIHGWLPNRGSPAYSALNRSAQSYEDAQNLFFREEELEDKLEREGLSFEEQATLEDIATIKAFFDTAATQLTPFGLSTITTSLAPGSVAILFRNDHFSTLYRHPDTLQLLQLVTDMGYAGHEEVVWESLIDVNGENAEFFSGDFRLVGGAPATPSQAHAHAVSQSNEGWTAIPIRNQHHKTLSVESTTQESIPETPRSPNTEQEDHDLALALQLQEEEEERHRNDLARRKRETELSQRFLEQQGRDNNVPVNSRGIRNQPHRGSSNPSNTGTGIRPAVPARRSNAVPAPGPVDPEAGVDVPPPTYEQASTQAAYVPQADHPAHPNSSPITARSNQSFASPAGRPQGPRRPTPNDHIEPQGRRRQSSSASAYHQQSQQQYVPGETRRDKDCAVM
jgi:hypothetical protein